MAGDLLPVPCSPPHNLHGFRIPVLILGVVNLNHFRLLRVVGRGAFGKVRIVERKDTNLSFALKYIRKDEGKPTRRIRFEYLGIGPAQPARCCLCLPSLFQIAWIPD